MLVWLMPWTAFIVQAVRQVPAKLAAFRDGLSKQQRGHAGVCPVAAFDPAVFQLLQPAGVLRAARSARRGAAAGRMAGERIGFTARQSPSGAAEEFHRWCCMCVGAAVVHGLRRTGSGRPRLRRRTTTLPSCSRKIRRTMRFLSDTFLISRRRRWALSKIPLLVTGFAFALGTILSLVLRRANRTFAANMALALMTVVLLGAAHQGLVIFSPVLSSKGTGRGH